MLRAGMCGCGCMLLLGSRRGWSASCAPCLVARRRACCLAGAMHVMLGLPPCAVLQGWCSWVVGAAHRRCCHIFQRFLPQ